MTETTQDGTHKCFSRLAFQTKVNNTDYRLISTGFFPTNRRTKGIIRRNRREKETDGETERDRARKREKAIKRDKHEARAHSFETTYKHTSHRDDRENKNS